VILGRDPVQREALWHDLRPRVFPITPAALAAIDIALWDLVGKVANLPLYQLLGGARERMPAYASTPLFPRRARLPALRGRAARARLSRHQIPHLMLARPGFGAGAGRAQASPGPRCPIEKARGRRTWRCGYGVADDAVPRPSVPGLAWRPSRVMVW